MKGKGGERMDALQWSTGVHALAMTLAQSMTTEELTQASLLFTQLGTTLATIAALQGLQQENGETAATGQGSQQ